MLSSTVLGRLVTPEPTARAAPAGPTQSLCRLLCIVLTCMLATFCHMFNMQSIALPIIEKELQIDQAKLEWIAAAYTFSSALALLVLGQLTELIGKRNMLFIGLLLALTSTFACGFAEDFLGLVIFRGLQGIGGSAISFASLGILTTDPQTSASEFNVIAIAASSIGASLGGFCGVLVGGALTNLTSPTWRSTFYFSAGLVFLCLLVGVWPFFDDSGPVNNDSRHFDWVGALLGTAGLLLFVIVLAQGKFSPQERVTDFIPMLLIGMLLLGPFVSWQIYLEHSNSMGNPQQWAVLKPRPLMKLSLWICERGRLALVWCIAFMTWGAFTSWMYWAQLYYQDYKGYSPVKTALQLLPAGVAWIVSPLISVALQIYVFKRSKTVNGSQSKRSYLMHVVVLMTSFGSILIAVAGLLFGIIKPSTSFWIFGFPGALLVIIGADCANTATKLLISDILKDQKRDIFSAMATLQMMTQMGTSLGLTVSTMIFHYVKQQHPEVANPLESYHSAFWVVFGLAVFGCLLSLELLRKTGSLNDSQDSEKPEERTEA